MIYLELIWCFFRVALFSVGGGYAAIPFIQYMVVELNHWLSISEFTDLVSIAEMTPGPITINAATFVGIRIAGIGGAAAATFGSVIPSMIIVSILAKLYMRYQENGLFHNILMNIRPSVAGLIGSAGLTLLIQTVRSVQNTETISFLGVIIFCAAFILLRFRKSNPVVVMTSCGCISLLSLIVSKILSFLCFA